MNDRTERFRRLFDECYAPLLAYARRRIAAAEVDDLVAETLTTAWRRLDDIPEGSELLWLYGVARRLLANQRRGSERRFRLVGRLAAERQSIQVREVGLAHGIEDALESLRPEDREILRLAAWEGLRPHEIGIVLGCTTNAAALRLSRARRRFRAVLTEQRGIWTSTERKVTDA